MANNTRPRQATPSPADRYLHAILLLTDHGQPADTGEVAAKVGVSDAAASHMLRALEKKRLVRVQPYRGAELTTEGMHRALRVVRRHRLLEVFLSRVLGFDLDQLHARALALQPAVDEEFEEKLDALLGSPRIDPMGRPIPAKNVSWPKLGDCPLVDLPAGSSGRVSRVLTDNAEAIGYLSGLGIKAGATIVLEGTSPFEGPVAVRVGGVVVHLGRRLAQAVHLAEHGAANRPATARIKVVRGSKDEPDAG
jgi:DtxR family transcriptional regulator, Mn-dependent transcriptional regulator